MANMTKADIEGLEELLKKSDQYVLDVFDWVAPLNEHSLLGRLYDFRAGIEAKITELKALPDEEVEDVA